MACVGVWSSGRGAEVTDTSDILQASQCTYRGVGENSGTVGRGLNGDCQYSPARSLHYRLMLCPLCVTPRYTLTASLYSSKHFPSQAYPGFRWHLSDCSTAGTFAGRSTRLPFQTASRAISIKLHVAFISLEAFIVGLPPHVVISVRYLFGSAHIVFIPSQCPVSTPISQTTLVPSTSNMFRLKEGGLPKDPQYPVDLKQLGYVGTWLSDVALKEY